YNLLSLLRRSNLAIPCGRCGQTNVSFWHRVSLQLRHLIVRAAVEKPAGGCFANTTPLLEEKGNSVAAKNLVDVLHPAFLHRACPYAAFTAHDCPMDAADLKLPKVFQKRLDGQEFDCCRRDTQMLDSG